MRDSHQKIRSSKRITNSPVRKRSETRDKPSPNNLTDCFFEHLEGHTVRRSSFVKSLKRSASHQPRPKRPSMISMEGLDISLIEALHQDETDAPLLQLKIPVSLEDSLRAFEAEMAYIEAIEPVQVTKTKKLQQQSPKSTPVAGKTIKKSRSMDVHEGDAPNTPRRRTRKRSTANRRRSMSAGAKDKMMKAQEQQTSTGKLAAFIGTRDERIHSPVRAPASRNLLILDAPEFVATPGRNSSRKLVVPEPVKLLPQRQQPNDGDNKTANYTDSFFDHMGGRQVRRTSFLTSMGGDRKRSSSLEFPRRPSMMSMCSSICSSHDSSVDGFIGTVAQLEIPGAMNDDDDASLKVLQVHFDKVKGYRKSEIKQERGTMPAMPHFGKLATV